MNIYADSSFFMSVYLRDGHTPDALRRLRNPSQIWFTPFHKIEIAHGIAQKVFRREMSLATANQVHDLLTEDLTAGLWVLADLPLQAFETGTAIARTQVVRLGTRTLDTIHVASALELKASQFWTFDERQAKLAKAVGLKVS